MQPTEIEKWLKKHYTLFLNFQKEKYYDKSEKWLGKERLFKKLKSWVSVNGTEPKATKLDTEYGLENIFEDGKSQWDPQ